jgi:hypothetical protein
MPRGIDLCRLGRQPIAHHYLVLKQHPSTIYDQLFSGLEDVISIETLKQICRRMDGMTLANGALYILGPQPKHPRRPRLLPVGSPGYEHLVQILRHEASWRLRSITYTFHQEFYDDHVDIMPASLSTVYRTIKLKHTRKVISW